MKKIISKKALILFCLAFHTLNMFIFKQVNAYSLTNERPVFLAWPLPSYIGVARISQFPNTPWTWNYLGLNQGMQCPPAFGYLEAWVPTWRDTSIPWEQDVAQADPHQFQMIECYSAGGEVGKNGHEATDIKAPGGTPVFASADGKVAGWRLNDLNAMIVLKHCLGGTWNENNECIDGVKWYTTYMHIIVDINFQQMDLDVSVGTQLGTIYLQGDNSHLHFEVGLEKRDYANYVNPWGRDNAPWMGCMWIDQSLCVQPALARRQFLFVNEDNQGVIERVYGRFIDIQKNKNAKYFQLNENRVGILQNDGVLLLGDFSGKPIHWTKIEQNIESFQISKKRIGILDNQGTLRVQEDAFNQEWKLQTNGVHSFSISDHRVGALTPSGELYIIEGELDNQWSLLAQGVIAFQVSDTRIAYVNNLGDLIVQEGRLTSEWKTMASNVKAFQISGVRVAFLNDNNVLWVNHGNLRAEFVIQAQDVSTFQLADNRILIQKSDETWMIKEGSLYQSWEPIQDDFAKRIFLNGTLSVFLSDN